MFRTFKPKRTTPCKGGFQHNIIYISHVTHALRIMYMMRKLFGMEPKYTDSVDDGKQLFPYALESHKHMTKDDYVAYSNKIDSIIYSKYKLYGNRYLDPHPPYFPYPM